MVTTSRGPSAGNDKVMLQAGSAIHVLLQDDISIWSTRTRTAVAQRSTNPWKRLWPTTRRSSLSAVQRSAHHMLQPSTGQMLQPITPHSGCSPVDATRRSPMHPTTQNARLRTHLAIKQTTSQNGRLRTHLALKQTTSSLDTHSTVLLSKCTGVRSHEPKCLCRHSTLRPPASVPGAGLVAALRGVATVVADG